MIRFNMRHAPAAMVVAAICATGAGAQAARPTAVIRLEPYPGNSDLLTVRASVNGHDRTFLFDSGDGVSMISPELAQDIGCKPWGQVTGFRMNGERIDAPHCDGLAFDAAGQHLAAPSVIVFDLMKFCKPGDPRLDGSLGLDLFAGRAITFEYSRKAIVVESPAGLAARVASGIEGDAAGEFHNRRQGSVIAPARVMDHMIMDGNINVPFLGKWDVALDFSRGRAWVAPAKTGQD